MEKSKISWYIAKLYKKSAVADPLPNYIWLWVWIDQRYIEWFDTEHVPQVTWKIDDTVMEHNDNELIMKMK